MKRCEVLSAASWEPVPMNLENVEEFLHLLIELPAKTQRRRASLWILSKFTVNNIKRKYSLFSVAVLWMRNPERIHVRYISELFLRRCVPIQLTTWSTNKRYQFKEDVFDCSLFRTQVHFFSCSVHSLKWYSVNVFIPKLVRWLRFEFWTILWLTFAIAIKGRFSLHLKWILQGNSESGAF